MEVGPVAAASAVAYSDFAESVLAERGLHLPADVRTSFDRYIGEWRTLAEGSDPLVWETEVEVEVVEYLVLAFYRLTQQVDAASGGPARARPDAVEPFYQALVEGLLKSMAEAGPGSAEFSDQLSSFWPRAGD